MGELHGKKVDLIICQLTSAFIKVYFGIALSYEQPWLEIVLHRWVSSFNGWVDQFHIVSNLLPCAFPTLANPSLEDGPTVLFFHLSSYRLDTVSRNGSKQLH